MDMTAVLIMLTPYMITVFYSKYKDHKFNISTNPQVAKIILTQNATNHFLYLKKNNKHNMFNIKWHQDIYNFFVERK